MSQQKKHGEIEESISKEFKRKYFLGKYEVNYPPCSELPENERKWFQINATGNGSLQDRPCFIVYLDGDEDLARTVLPREYNGILVHIIGDSPMASAYSKND